MAKPINLQPSGIEQTAQTVAATISQAARPGPVPPASAGSPVDAAAAAVAGAVVKNVAAASAQLAPKGAEGLALTQAATTGAVTKDEENAGRIKAVPADMQEHPQTRSGAGVQAESFATGGTPLAPPTPTPPPMPSSSLPPFRAPAEPFDPSK